MHTLRRWLMGLAGTGVLATVFMLYTRPDFLVQMVNQLWACF